MASKYSRFGFQILSNSLSKNADIKNRYSIQNDNYFLNTSHPFFFFLASCSSLTANHFLLYVLNVFFYLQGAIHYIWQSVQMGLFSLILYIHGRGNEPLSLHWVICTRFPNRLIIKQHCENCTSTCVQHSKDKQNIYLYL